MSKNAQFNFHPQFDLFCSLRSRPFTICTTISKSCAKMLPQPVLLLWNCPQRCQQVQ